MTWNTIRWGVVGPRWGIDYYRLDDTARALWLNLGGWSIYTTWRW